MRACAADASPHMQPRTSRRTKRMTFAQELASWRAPPKIPVATPPTIGSKAPSTPALPIPAVDGRPVVVTFLRHCGCPFAEATFLDLREAASKNPTVRFVAVSHSDQASTDKWLKDVGGTASPSSSNAVDVIVDPERKTYAAWGLGTSSFAHVLSPAGLYAVYKIGKERGIWNRPTESGSRWQTAGSWAVDGKGLVRWGSVARRADVVPDFGEAVEAVKAS
ncbi:uncharacterized protein PV09_04531 [Verruconis gallopava]|uniref:Uncharacterized protein n=1 Tax=Verruconis gallopava TaxID=253628 RepID=A0A0D2AYH8_9PEZI|nr:uncharacterized protein PV09_04531 [Verruconis gallopava]KIW04224.1 hypothetical protein PV09_04531 [Verruconis gallopava]